MQTIVLDTVCRPQRCGGVELLLCPNLTANQRSGAGGKTRQNIAAIVLMEIWAARQRRPTAVAHCVALHPSGIFNFSIFISPASHRRR
jgi:hypothetical protein